MNYEQARILKNVAKRTEVQEQLVEDLFDRVLELENQVSRLADLVVPLERPVTREREGKKRTKNA